jgi:1-acyl-sn-glycerol-3-phosphate acyltransferase
VSTLIAAIRSIATYVSIALYVALIGTPFVLFAVAIGNAAILYRVGDIGVRLGLFLSGITFTVEGAWHIQQHRAAVYAVNHASNIEPPILFSTLRDIHPRLRILYKAELRRLPILVHAFDLAGFVPLERGNPEQSLPAIEAAGRALRDGASFLIFPEGTRSRSGSLLPFKKGGFIMAIKGQAPIVPVAVTGARNALRKGSFIIRPVQVRVRFAPPIETAGLGQEDRDALVTEVRERVQSMLLSS